MSAVASHHMCPSFPCPMCESTAVQPWYPYPNYTYYTVKTHCDGCRCFEAVAKRGRHEKETS